MPTARFATTLADAQSLETFFARQVNGASITDDLAAEYGACDPITVSLLRAWQADEWRCVMGFDDATPAVLRGCAIANGDRHEIEIKIIAMDKRLNAQQRLDGMRFLFDWVATNIPAITGATRVHGLVKEGGRIDLFMNGKLSGRELERAGFIRYRTTAAELKASVQ